MATKVRSSREPYVGERAKQLREGYGVYTYENKFFRYEGEWKQGKKDGHGKLIMADGSYYEGEFEFGEIEGHGFRYFASSGNKYSGQFHLGEMHGQGVMTYASGSTYEGEWARNVRQGFGVFRCSDDDSVYQGHLHNNKRHGEGTQVYSNGDRYDGDWVQDKRQGHGELRQRDGTIYDGQWKNDLMNGQGSMHHASGVIYEGLWINGKPAQMAHRLVIKEALEGAPLEVLQGAPFNVTIELHNYDGEVQEENGREIQILAGFRNVQPTVDTSPSKENTQSGLFDAIEDMAETPISTPFGYDIVLYPITDQFKFEELYNLGIGSRTNTNLSDQAVAEAIEEKEPGEEEKPKPADPGPAEAEGATEATPGVTTEGCPAEEGESSEDRTDSPTGGTVSDAACEQAVQQTCPSDATPPPTNKRSQAGTAAFNNLVLISAPPMYRPFAIMDAEERARTSRSRGSKKSDDEGSRPTTRGSKKDAKANIGDPRFARGGEYVIIVKDVTSPPFLETTLEPAYLQVKVNVPKKVTKKPPRTPGPRWDTSKHIAQSMAEGYSQAAREEISKLT